MVKKYHSKSCISLSVVIKDGISAHISFSPLTGGGSVYYTDNEDLQKALERHHMYGKLFKEEIIPAVTEAPAKSKKKAAKAKESADEGAAAEEQEGSELNEIQVTDLEDARNYLAETYGVSRTKIRFENQIKEYAKSKGIVLVGI